MASILRSSKFVRYIAGFARNVVINTPREFDGNFVNTSQCLCGAIKSPFSSQPSLQYEQHLEKSLKKIDQDVRKSGRISRRDIEDVLEEIRNSRSATTSQSLLVIRCCGNLVPDELPEIRTKLVKEIWNTLNKLNIPMDVSHYNALLRVYLENEHPFSPVEFLAEMKEHGVEPNRVTYQRLIARYCQDGDIEGATSVLEHMRQKELPVNENVFNALIIGHSHSGDMESAHGILSIMAQAGLEPSADTYTTLLCGYAKKGDIESMKKIIEECETKEVFLLDKDYLDIAAALAINDHIEHMPEILSKVRKSIGFNQDAVNTILSLVNKAKDEAAYKILRTMVRNTDNDGEPLPSGGFFVRQLVRMRRPLKVIFEMCERLQEDGLLETPLNIALQVSLETGNEEFALAIIEEMQKRGHAPKQHYFWPLLCARAKDEGNEGVVRILKSMKRMGVKPNGETMREYITPNLKGKASEIIEILNEADISVASCAMYLGLTLLDKGNIEEAAVIMSKISAYYNPEMFKRHLTQAYYKTKDLNSYIVIVREIYDNLDRLSMLKEGGNIPKKEEVIGNLILDLTSNEKEFKEKVVDILTALIDEGLSISTKAAEQIQEKLGTGVNDQISSLLDRLSSGDLIPVPSIRKPPAYTPAHQMNIEQLEKFIENSSIKKFDTRGLKRQLLSLYYRAKNLEKSEELLEELKRTPDFMFNGGIYAQLMDLYAYHENLEKALYYYEKLKESEGDNLVLSDSKVLRLAYVLSKNGRFEESLKLLEECPRDRVAGEEDSNFSYTSLAWRFLNSLAEQGNVEDLNKLFDLLVSKEYVSVSNVLLGPLVKVHLVNDQLDKALAKFEECVNMYKSTPWKNELACKLIQAEDAAKLQKLTDLSTTVHGEINSLYDLVFSFIECGRVRQARKILETPGLQSRTQRVNFACERYRQEGLLKPLEDLKDVTKHLNNFDRSEIYQQLLLSYIKEDDSTKAIGLWTQMQEEDLPPSDKFLIALGEYLQKKGMDVPFIIPEQARAYSGAKTEDVKYAKNPALHTFRSLMKNNEYLKAFDLHREVKDKWSIVDGSGLIEKLVQNNEYDKAAMVTMEMLAKNNPPITRIFKFVINKFALAGRLDDIKAIGEKISMDMKKNVSFDNRLCHATVVVGKAQEYLNYLEKEIDAADTEEKLKNISEKFPRGGAYGILDKHPELLEQFEVLAEKFCNKGVSAPANILWTHYFCQGHYEKADELWGKFLKSSPRIMFQRIVHAARDNQNEEMVKKLIEHLKSCNITSGALGNAYSALLDVEVSKNQYEKVLETFEIALKEVGINNLNRTAVLRVKSVYDRLGKPFNQTIPLKNIKNQTSSSSSSSDVEQKAK